MTTAAIWKSFEAQIATLEQEREAVRQVFQHLVSTPQATTASPPISTDTPSSDRQEWFDDSSKSHNPHKESSIASISLASTPLFICQLVLDCQGDRSLLQRRLLDSEMSLFSQIQACRETQLRYTPNPEQQIQLDQFEKDERIRLAEIVKDKEVELARITKEERIELAKVEKDVEQIAKEKEIRLAEIIAEVRKIIKDERWDVRNFDKEKQIELAKIHKDVTKIHKDERWDIRNFAKEKEIRLAELAKEERVRLAEVDHDVKKLEKEKATRLAEIDRHDCQTLAQIAKDKEVRLAEIEVERARYRCEVEKIETVEATVAEA